MKKVLFVARDPGGANSILPIIQEYNKTYLCDIFAKDFASNIFKSGLIDYKEINDIKDIYDNLNNYSLFFTGTSFNDNLEQELWEYSHKNNIVSIAYLDHWMGYDRFFNKEKNRAIFPKKLIVVDQIAKKAFLSRYPNADIEIVCLGSAFLEKFLLLKNNTYNNNNNTIIYAAEKIKGFEIENKYGFNEYLQFLKLFEALKTTGKDYILYFLPHPKHNYDDIYEELKDIIKQNSNIKIIINKQQNKDKLIKESSKVFGINTMVLVEAMLIGKNTCSIQIGIKEPSDFQLIKHNYIYNADTNNKLSDFINNKISNKQYDTSYIKNSTNKILEYIKSNV